jgi:hypothetical protein
VAADDATADKGLAFHDHYFGTGFGRLESGADSSDAGSDDEQGWLAFAHF